MPSTSFSIGVNCIYINDLNSPIYPNGQGLQVTMEMAPGGEKTEVKTISFRSKDLIDSIESLSLYSGMKETQT